MNAVLLVAELLLLTATALVLHAVSGRYGLVPLLVYLAGIVAILQGLGAEALIVEPWPGLRVVASDATLVPTVLLVFLILYDADGAAVARTALGGVVGVSFVGLTAHVARMAHVRLADTGEFVVAADAFAPELRMVAASIAAFLVGVTALVGVYQGARNHLRFLPMWAVRALSLFAAAAADTATFRALAFPLPLALAGLATAVTGKSAAVLLVAPVAAWYLARVAPRLPAYVGPEDRGTLDILFGRYGHQEVELRTTRGEMRQTEARLRETDARFRHTFELAAVGIVHTTANGTVLLANRAVASFLGCRPGELDGRKLSSFLPDLGDGGPEEGPFLRSGELRFLRGDGGTVWGLTHTTEVRDEAGLPSYHIVVIEDITARRAAEDRLRRVERLEAIGRLTGGVAHDFNNLLAVIIGDTEDAISRAATGADAAESLAPVMRAARKGAKLTHQLLAYAGQQVLQPEPLECGRFLQSMSELLRMAAGGGVELVISAEPGLVAVADRTHLESVLLSLATNAREAMPNGGRLTIRAYREPASAHDGTDGGPAPAAPYVTIEVADTGRGMSPETAARAFEPFFTTKPVGQGSGLGLSMAYGFASQSGGQADLESEPGRGTRVRLRLPTPGRPAPSATEAPAGAQRAGEAILVVEDDREVARVLSHALERVGYRVTAAGDAPEALASMARVSPSLVITDVVLPGETSGADLAVAIHRGYPGVPILFVSGYSIEFLQSTCRLPVGADVLMKPFESTELARRVRALLDKARG